MNFSSDNIELFLAVLDRGSFSAAARALRRVPSAVSMGIANMEAELGFALFDRSHREPGLQCAAGCHAVGKRQNDVLRPVIADKKTAPEGGLSIQCGFCSS